MSLLFRSGTLDALEEAVERRMGTHAGVVVTPERALRHSAVWGSLAAISEAFLTLPLREVRREGGVDIYVDPPVWMEQPQPGIPWQSWIWQQIWTLAAKGRCYGQITRVDAQGYPLELIPVPDESVRWQFHFPTKTWVTYVDNVEMLRWPLGPLWHCPLYPVPGQPMGMSPIRHHAETIGVGLAAQEFGARFFGDGGHPTMLIKAKKDPGERGATRLKDQILSVLGGSREPIVIPADTELEKWQISPDESQFLDTMRYSGEDVARIFGVKPSKIGIAVSGQNVTYTNVRDENDDWRTSGLARYTGAFEGAFGMLLPGGRRRKIKLDFAGFLKADPETRYKIYKLAAEVGAIAGTPVLLPNEMRADEGRPPLDGGDAFARLNTPEPTQTRSEET